MAKKKKKRSGSFIKKWRKEAISMYGKSRGLDARERAAVTAVVHEKLGTRPKAGKALPKARKPTKRRKKKMAKKKGTVRRKRKFSILSGVALAGFAFPGGEYSPIVFANKGQWNNMWEALIRNMTGFGFWAGEWRASWLIKGWTPTIIALLAKKAVGWLGLNRYFRDFPVNL